MPTNRTTLENFKLKTKDFLHFLTVIEYGFSSVYSFAIILDIMCLIKYSTYLKENTQAYLEQILALKTRMSILLLEYEKLFQMVREKKLTYCLNKRTS